MFIDWKCFSGERFGLWAFFLFTDGFALDFSTCSNPVKDNACNMTCTTQDFNQIIRILCNGSSVGSCGLLCSTDMYKEGSTIVYFSIARLSYQTHLCDWSCAYGSSNSPPSSFTIYSKYKDENIML